MTTDGPSDAPVVLLLHGFTSSANAWSLVVPQLATDHRVVRVDLLGHGRTGGAAADAPLQTDAVTAVLRDLDLHDVTVVGHSFGADVAVDLAERGERVARVVVVAQAPDYSDADIPRAGALMTGRFSPWLWRGVRGLVGVVAATTSRGPARDLLARRGGELAGLATTALRDLRALDPAMFRIVLIDRRDRMAARPLDAQLVAAGLPALVVLGGHDHFYGDRPAARYRAAGARVEVVAESGHALPISHPAELAAFIAGFVAEAAAPAPARPV